MNFLLWYVGRCCCTPDVPRMYGRCSTISRLPFRVSGVIFLWEAVDVRLPNLTRTVRLVEWTMAGPPALSATEPGNWNQRSAPDLSSRNTWVLTGFTAVTNLTDGGTKVALPLIATSLTSSPALVSGVFFCLTLPWLVVSLPVGVLVDRFNRRMLLRQANGVRIITVLALAVAVATHTIRLPMLYLGALTLGGAEVIALTTAAALIPDVVLPADRERANTWITAAETVCNEFVGPFLGGLLTAVGMLTVLSASAGGYLIGIALLPLLVGRFKIPRADTAPASVHSQIADGLRFFWHQRLLRMLTLTVSVLVTCWAAWFALMPLVATKIMGLSPVGYGALVGALGVGGLVGTVAAGTVNRLFGRRWVMFANIFFTASMVAVPAVTANPWAAGFAAFLGGMGGTLWVINARSISQTLVGAEMMGRYNAVARLLGWGSVPLGAALAGALGEVVNHRLVFGLFALTTTVVIVPFLRTFTRPVLADLNAKAAVLRSSG